MKERHPPHQPEQVRTSLTVEEGVVEAMGELALTNSREPVKDWRVTDGHLFDSEWVAALQFALPVGTGWALHPASKVLFNERLEGRCPMSIQREDCLRIRFLVEDDSAETNLALRALGEDIASSVGLPPTALEMVQVRLAESTES